MEPDVTDRFLLKHRLTEQKEKIPTAAYLTESGNDKYFLPFTNRAYEVFSVAHRSHASIFSQILNVTKSVKRST